MMGFLRLRETDMFLSYCAAADSKSESNGVTSCATYHPSAYLPA